MCPELNYPIALPGVGRTPGDGQLHVSFINVGMGDCTYIICPNGKRILIDAGSKNMRGTSLQDISTDLHHVTFNEAYPELTYLELDILILTHGHQDHNNLILQVVGSSLIQRVYYGGDLQRDYSSGYFWRWTQFYYNCPNLPQPLTVNTPTVGGIPPAILICDGTQAGPGAMPCSVWVYAANVPVTSPGALQNEHYRQNTNSIVTRIVFGADTVMICGDATVDTEAYLTANYSDALTARNLLIPHHGSDSSSARPFMQATDPQFAVISCVAQGTHNLPKKSVVDDYLLPTFPNGRQRALLDGQPAHIIDTFNLSTRTYEPTTTTKNIWQTGSQNQSFTVESNGQ